MATPGLRVLIAAEHTSARFGGEAALPLHYFRVLRSRGYQVWLVTHSRTRQELTDLFPNESRIVYVEDSLLHRMLWQVARRLPDRIANVTVGFVSRFSAQLVQRRLIARLVKEQRINVIHQPMPVSPQEPSMLYGFGIPVIIGPMNGGMEYPPAFRHAQPVVERLLIALGRWSSLAVNWIMPGKRRAAFLLVANERTRLALPRGVAPRVIQLVENGVDLDLWLPPADLVSTSHDQGITTFVFVGRLIELKAVDLLLEAFERARHRATIRLVIIGDGIERPKLQRAAAELDVLATTRDDTGCVFFEGWLSQKECALQVGRSDCLVLPSLMECGGAVVLEAMAMSKPVIATRWGGPADYLDESCGVLVPPSSREALINGLEEAMVYLATNAEMRQQMGRNARQKVMAHYDWNVKVDRVLEIYAQARDERLRSTSSN